MKKPRYYKLARSVCPWHHVNDFCVHCDAIAAAVQKAVDDALKEKKEKYGH